MLRCKWWCTAEILVDVSTGPLPSKNSWWQIFPSSFEWLITITYLAFISRFRHFLIWWLFSCFFVQSDFLLATPNIHTDNGKSMQSIRAASPGDSPNQNASDWNWWPLLSADSWWLRSDITNDDLVTQRILFEEMPWKLENANFS